MQAGFSLLGKSLAALVCPPCALYVERTFGQNINQVSLLRDLNVLVVLVCCNQSRPPLQVSKCLSVGRWKDCLDL